VVSEVVMVDDAPPAVRLVVGARKSSDEPGRMKPHVRLIAGGVDRIAGVFASSIHLHFSVYILTFYCTSWWLIIREYFWLINDILYMPENTPNQTRRAL
jgi:hypothetical protein